VQLVVPYPLYASGVHSEVWQIVATFAVDSWHLLFPICLVDYSWGHDLFHYQLYLLPKGCYSLMLQHKHVRGKYSVAV
jgi:hypothetical protein